MEVTVEIDNDGKVSVTISDETGYNPEIIETMARQARETAVATHRETRSVSK